MEDCFLEFNLGFNNGVLCLFAMSICHVSYWEALVILFLSTALVCHRV